MDLKHVIVPSLKKQTKNAQSTMSAGVIEVIPLLCLLQLDLNKVELCWIKHRQAALKLLLGLPISVCWENALTSVFHALQSEYDEFISSGLYLVVLLHFCEQRFSDVLGAVDTAGVRNRTNSPVVFISLNAERLIYCPIMLEHSYKKMLMNL